MKKAVLFLLCFNSMLFGNIITLQFLQDKPKGIARDFYIWRFLQNPDIPLDEAIQAYDLLYRKTPKLKKLMTQKGYISELPQEVKCKHLSFEELKTQDTQCIAYGIKLPSVAYLPTDEVNFLIQVLQADYPMLVAKIQILASKNIPQALKDTKNARAFGELFFDLTYNQRQKFYNQNFSPSFLATLASQNQASFNRLLQYILLSNKFNTFRSAILKAKLTLDNPNILLLLGVTQLQANHKTKALYYFSLMQQNAKLASDKDKALFWQYLITKKQSFLQELAKSNDANLYSIYANQKLKTSPQYSIISSINLPLRHGQAQFDITNPFEWQILKEEVSKANTPNLESMIETQFNFFETEPHLAFALNRYNRYKTHFFIMPYAENLTWQNNHQKALTYAIAKQESNFLPALVSTSYALGMMQIMPFNVKPFAKALNKPDVTLDDLFKPEIALELGRHYLAELESEFKHPLFVAYAYNGGPGFFRRTLKQKKLFVKSRPYEPWLSLELIPYEESRKYGQIVLANYIIYQQILGKDINLETFLKQTLIN